MASLRSATKDIQPVVYLKDSGNNFQNLPLAINFGSKHLIDLCVNLILIFLVLKGSFSLGENKIRLNKSFRFAQCIIDECGMCSEPETLAPIIASKAKQVITSPIVICCFYTSIKFVVESEIART